ncbi:hypothetical protein, partial [Salmonella enterica]|uniref:hypothetical protein n=1 Tax=Salmonella enterica TaxID=28901 RepID=UPI0035252D00
MGTDSRQNKTIIINNPNRVNQPLPQESPLTLEERKLLAKPLNIYNDSLVTQYNTVQKRLANTLDKKVFGASLFQNDKLSFEPNMRIATPKNYQLGPDDELDI